MDITFRQLEIFRWVVIAGSITKASQRIGLSQPSISQQLAKLEETLSAQLIVRNRTGLVSMTPAGEFWFKASEEVLGRMAVMMNEHEQRFRHANVVLRLGTTPALRGRFTAAAARIAQQEQSFVKFELVYDVNSNALVEQLRMHRINFAIVAESAMAAEQSSFAIAKLFEDNIAFAVPATVPDEAIRYALSAEAEAAKVDPVLKRYVEIDAAVPTRGASDDWYRHRLPAAMPVFGAPTFASSVEFVADGLATCHLPLSLLPNLSASVRERIKLFQIEGMNRTAVLAMRKHLLTHAAFSRIFHSLTDFCRTEYATEMADRDIRPLAHVLPPATPILVSSRGAEAVLAGVGAKAAASVAKPMTSIGKSVSR